MSLPAALDAAAESSLNPASLRWAETHRIGNSPSHTFLENSMVYGCGQRNVSRFVSGFLESAEVNLPADTSDAALLRCFLSHLDGPALVWADKYVAEKIKRHGEDWLTEPRAFDFFLEEFRIVFGDTIKPAPSRIHISQQEGETAKDYLKRAIYLTGGISQRNMKLVDSFVQGLLPPTYATYKKSYIDTGDYHENVDEAARVADELARLRDMYKVWGNKYDTNREEWVDMEGDDT